MNLDLTENQVLKIWQGCAGRDDLETEDDGPVKVIYPGRANDGGGADFRDAVIQTSHGLLTGDIEIHTRSSQWRAHRHHLDPLYNRVVLHIVFRHDIEKPVVLENGRSVPTLALRKMPAPGDFLPAALPAACRGFNVTGATNSISEILDNAGEQRFRARAAGFQTVTSPEEAAQALYRGIMAALGYSKNKHPMSELACRMPLRRLEAPAAEAPDMECLASVQALLTGMAGLLPSKRVRCRADDENLRWIEELEKRWSAAGETAAMSENDWQFFRVRPVNFPDRRIAAMSVLLLRYRDKGLLEGLIDVLQTVSIDSRCNQLENALLVEAENSRYPDKTALLGRSRAAVIIINVLLPFAVAWGRLNSRPELVERALAIYRRYPPLAANTLERHMGRQLGIGGSVVNTARRQQGLIHLFKTFCSIGGCLNCPLNKEN